MLRLYFRIVLTVCVGGWLGYSLARDDQVTESSPAYDYFLAKVVSKESAIDMGLLRQGSELTCVFPPYAGWDQVASAADLSIFEMWTYRRLVDADRYSVLLKQKGQVTDAFLVAKEAFNRTNVADVAGTCGKSLVLESYKAEPIRTVSPKGAVSGQRQEINWALMVNQGCKPGGMPSIVIAMQPAHGRVFVESGLHYPAFDKKNSRWVCNEREMPAQLVYYQSDPGYVGADRVQLDVVFPDGKVTLWDHPVTVR
jgi:hypothetical protein